MALGGAFTALAGLSTAGYAEVGTGLGTLRVVNELDPPSNSGKFNLQIHGVSYKENATDGEDTGVQTVYAGTNTVGETAGTRTSPADYVTSIECVDAADNVVASGTGAGPLDVEVADGEDVVCTITNRYQVATELSVTGLPGTATAGSTQSPTITVLDQNGDAFDRYRGTVEITSTDPQADLPADYTFTAVDDGSHTFTNAVSLKTAGDQTLTATDTANTSLTDTSDPVTVSAADAASLEVTAPAYRDGRPAVSATVTAKDAFDNTATGYRGTVSFSSSDGTATLPADRALTAGDDGAISVQATFKTAGSRTLTATDTASPSITGTSGPVSVGAADATSLTVTAPGTATAGQAVTATVTAIDTFGNTATGYRGTVGFSSSDGFATTPADHEFTAGDAGTFSADVLRSGPPATTP